MRWITVGLLLTAAIFEASFSNAQQYPFVHYTPKDGLVSARSRSMFQDSKGRLYIAGFGGLSVYDGVRFTNYTTDNGLAANIVNEIVELGEDSIWIFPNVNRIQCLVRGRLKNYTTKDGYCPVINKLIKASDGKNYVLADEGLFRFDKDRFTRININPVNGKEINKYLSDGIEIDGKFYLITDATFGSYPSPSYLIVYDIKNSRSYISKKPPEVYDLALSPQNDILASTDEGLKALDKNALQNGEIHFIYPSSTYLAGKNKVASSLYFDHDQHLWMTTADAVYKIDQRGRIKSYSVENGLLVNKHYSVFQDKEKIMWFINEQTGISKLSNSELEFYSQIKPGFIASDLYADNHSDSVWLMDRQQKKLLVLGSGASKEFSINKKFEWIFRFIPGKQKDFVTGYFELYQFDKHQKNTINPQLIRNYRDSMQGVPMVNFPMTDNYGNLLYSNDKINVVLSNGKQISYPLGYFGDQFVISPENELWITNRANKLFLFKIHPEDPDNYFELLKTFDSCVPKGPRSVTIDKNRNIWIGTRDLGVYCFEVDNGFNLKLKHELNTKSGLSDNCVLNLYCDEHGSIWLCSPVGLDKARLNNGKWIVENITRGNNIYQNVIKVNGTRNGEKWVLTSSGVIKINPASQSSASNFKASILLTEVRTGRDSIDFLHYNSGISYKKNDLYIEWAVPTFKDEKQTRYSYLLSGSNTKDWSEPSTEASIRFINLPPGKYNFHVKAVFTNGLYPDTETSYAFEILPPWWDEWWAKSLALLIILSIALISVRSYVRRKLQKQLHALEKKQAIERERRRIASDMHDDLGAGLTSIRFLSQKVKENSTNDNSKAEIGKIANISGELFENMNEIIWAMNEKNDSLEDLLLYTRTYVQEYCEENNLECISDFPETVPQVFVSGEVRRNIFLTIKESLHNIVKHSSATQVKIKVCLQDQLSIQINDNGKGFAAAGVNSYSGGNGLINMRRRLQLIGGHLEISSGKGITVSLHVPLQKLAPGML